MSTIARSLHFFVFAVCAARFLPGGQMRFFRSGTLVRFFTVLVSIWTLSISTAQADTSKDLETALRLASLLQEARAVIASNQDLINDPNGGDKGLTGEHVVGIARDTYQKANGVTPLYDGQESREARLIAAQMTAIRQVMDENQATINSDGIGFKGFVPAVFARLVNERFSQIVGDEAVVKVTAPPELIRNRKSRPDAWETKIIQDQLTAAEWPEGDVFASEAEFRGQKAYRVLVPEFYSEGCMSCHGAPKGEIDITGYPKEGGSVGELGGVISISLIR